MIRRSPDNTTHDVRECACASCVLARYWHSNPGILAPQLQAQLDERFAVSAPPASIDWIASPGSELASQLEELFDAVWQAERNWNFDDRLDLALRF